MADFITNVFEPEQCNVLVSIGLDLLSCMEIQKRLKRKKKSRSHETLSLPFYASNFLAKIVIVFIYVLLQILEDPIGWK